MRTVNFKIDMMKVWGLIYVIARDLNYSTNVKSDQRKRYRSKAYRDLLDHFLVPDNVENMASEAKRLLAAMYYSGDRKRFNFERYVKKKKKSTTSLKGSRNMGMWGLIPGPKLDI